MKTLYQETKQALSRGLENPIHRDQWVQSTVEEALTLLMDKGIAQQEAEKLWTDVDEEFFLRERAGVIARCTAAILKAGDSKKPVIFVENAGMEVASATRIFVYTPGYQNVFAITAATLDQLHLNIQDARLNRSSNGHTFDMFYVLNEQGLPFGNDKARVQKVVNTLISSLESADKEVPEVQRRTSLMLKQFNLKTRTYLQNDAVGNLTALEVVTPDRPGLLAHLGRIFMRFGIRLHRARIATLGERVEDVFYITDSYNQPLSDPDFCMNLQHAICSELDERNSGAGSVSTTPQSEPVPWQ